MEGGQDITDGLRVVIMRFMQGFAIILLMVVPRVAFSVVNNITANQTTTDFAASQMAIEQNVNIIYPLIGISIFIAILQGGYWILQKRKNEMQYTETNWENGMYGR